eukprot:539435-Pleurochrysis_carterae.AAC.1
MAMALAPGCGPAPLPLSPPSSPPPPALAPAPSAGACAGNRWRPGVQGEVPAAARAGRPAGLPAPPSLRAWGPSCGRRRSGGAAGERAPLGRGHRGPIRA